MNRRYGIIWILLVLPLSGWTARAADDTEWRRRIEIDSAGVTTESAFLGVLKQNGVGLAGYTNYYTGRWPYISFVGGMSMGNNEDDLEFFFEKPFKWWNHILDYVMEGGGRKFGIRATVRRYKDLPAPAPMRSYLLTIRTDTLLKEYHPSYIYANGRKIWDAKKHPLLDGKLLVPFSVEQGVDPVIDMVVDLDYTPEVKGLAFRMFFVQNLGEVTGNETTAKKPAPIKVDLRGADETASVSPADKLEKFAFGVFPSGYDFWTDNGPSIAGLKKSWKPNFRPDYPVDDVYLAPALFDAPARGKYHDFMLSYGGCNVACNKPDPALLKASSPYLRAILSSIKNPDDAKSILNASPNLEVHWYQEGSAPGTEKVESAKRATGQPQRVKAIWEVFSPSLPAMRDYERGNDLLVFKNEEDPQYNILMSMGRGAGRSYGKPFGFYWEQTHCPFPSVDEKLHCCLLYYFSGGSHIGAEAENAPAFEKGIVADWVYPYVKALRFAMVHPARGTPIVPIGILFTDGDRWVVPYNNFGLMDTFQRHVEYDHATHSFLCEPSTIHPYPWMPPDRSKWGWKTTGHLSQEGIDRIPETRGYDLLDVFLPHFGDAYTARITRLLTGTPYGPLDFVYGDKASGEHLKSFGVIAVLGHARVRGAVEQKIIAAVESGSSLLVGAQHIQGTNTFGDLEIVVPPAAASGKLVAPAGILNGEGGQYAGRVHAFKGAGWETAVSISDKPLVITKIFGKGRVYVYLGEWIGEGGSALRPILNDLGERAALLKFSNPNDYLEYVAYRKGAGAWIAVFNHSNIAIGCDRLKELRAIPPEPLCSTPQGPYKGVIEFRLEKMGLDPKSTFALYEVEGIDGKAFEDVISGNKTFSLKPLKSDSKDGVIRATLEIDKRAQYLIAPAGQGETVFFGKP